MSTHRFSLLSGNYAVARLAPDWDVPGWATAADEFVSVTRTPHELSIVCPEASVPHDVRAERGWRIIKLQGPFPFDQLGVLASFAAPLAEARVSIFALSTFDTDHILIKNTQIEPALRALRAAGHSDVS